MDWTGCLPYGVFQTVLFRFLTSVCDKGKPLQRDKECLKTPVFSSISVHSVLADPDHTLNSTLRKTPFRKHRLLLSGPRDRPDISTGQTGHVHRMVAIQEWRRPPAKFLYVSFVFFSSHFGD